jgi:hypothetical protein
MSCCLPKNKFNAKVKTKKFAETRNFIKICGRHFELHTPFLTRLLKTKGKKRTIKTYRVIAKKYNSQPFRKLPPF